jgi:hypothetical protein
MPMAKKSFDHKLSGTVELDLCFACRGIWFDKYENLQIEASGVIELFRLINEHRGDPQLQLEAALPCPRCGDTLAPTMDRSKSGAFNYLRCLGQHGHFIVFAQFMIEKGFVRQLSHAELQALKSAIGVVHCSGCGGPIDIRKDSACPFCHAPLALLDPQAVESALAAYVQSADTKHVPCDAKPLADVVGKTPPEPRVFSTGADVHADIGDLLIDGLATTWRHMLNQ